MNHTDLRTALDRLGLTQVGAARALGVNPRTMRRWVSGNSDIPKWLGYALIGLANH